MSKLQVLAAALFVAALTAVPPAAMAQLRFLGTGSSAMWQTFALASYNDVCGTVTGTPPCFHYTITGKNSGDNQNYAQLVDSRSVSIPVEGGNLWVVWDSSSPKNTWAYLSVDSTVGVRAFLATPRATLQVDSGVLTAPGQNKIAAALFKDDSSDVTAGLPSDVLAAVQTAVTAGLTTYRAEDAKFVTNRTLAALDTAKLTGLGYGTVSANCPNATLLIGCPILSSYGGAQATPVQFNTSGKDPFTAKAIPKYVQLEVGAEPIVILYNNSDTNGLGALNASGSPAFSNINHFVLASFLNGSLGLAQDLDLGLVGNTTPVTSILLEPISGTSQTVEFNVTRSQALQKAYPALAGQEAGVNLANANTNPLELPGPGGSQRVRAIAISQGVSGNKNVGGIKNTADSLAEIFFSFGNVSPIAGAGGVGRYVTLDGVDAIYSSYGANPNGPGVLPTCANPCPVTPGTSFPNVRNGSYPIWNVLRVLAAPNDNNVKLLVTSAQNEVNNKVPDFVPFVCTGGVGTGCNDGNGNVEPGLRVFHSHFAIPKVAAKPSNGNTGETAEAGGDVGGGVFPIGADLDYFNDTGKQLINFRQ